MMRRGLLLSTLLMATSACSMSEESMALSVAPSELATRLAAIKAMIGDAAADDAAQCKMIGVGHKPCGGPAFYLPYSTRDVDERQLVQLITAYNQLAMQHNQQSGMISDCAIVPIPQVNYVDGFCTLGTAAASM